MAMPPIVLTSQTVRLIHPLDEAIDREASGQVWVDYCELKHHDSSKLVLKSDSSPTWFEVRALNDREDQTLFSLLTNAQAAEEASEKTYAQAEWVVETVRVGLVAVENLEGWDDTRKSRLYGMTMWDADLVGALGTAIGFLFKVIRKLTDSGSDSKKKSSGSSPVAASGTDEAADQKSDTTARDRSTVATIPRKKTA